MLPKVNVTRVGLMMNLKRGRGRGRSRRRVGVKEEERGRIVIKPEEGVAVKMCDEAAEY